MQTAGQSGEELWARMESRGRSRNSLDSTGDPPQRRGGAELSSKRASESRGRLRCSPCLCAYCENRRGGGGRGCCGLQCITRFLHTLQSLTPRDRVRLYCACSPLPVATKGNAHKAARIKLPCGDSIPPRSNRTSKRLQRQPPTVWPGLPQPHQEPAAGAFSAILVRARPAGELP
jgi:hypothetical protein